MLLVAAQLRKLRIEKALTQSQVGAFIQMSATNYQKFEYGYNKPSINQLIAFAKGLNTSVEYLTRGRENNIVYREDVVPFHKRLKELREQNGMTQKQLAALIKSNESGVQKYEYNENTPRLERIIQLADIFGVTMDEMVGRVKK